MSGYAAGTRQRRVTEQTIQQQIRLTCSRGPVRLHRNNTGTPDMVGQRIAVFTSIEVKTPTGRVSPEQRQWLEAVQAAGGIAGVARSVEDALRIVAVHG